MPTIRPVSWPLSIGICALAWAGVYATPAHASSPSPEQLEQSCAKGVAAGCLSLGLLFELGEGGVSKDELRAAKLYEQACTAGEPRGCNNLGILYEEGLGTPKDPQQAAGFYEKACSGGYSTACFNLGSLYLNGSGVAKNETRAAKLFDRACRDNQAQACFRLSVLYGQGRGVEQDKRKAVFLLKTACTLGEERACPENHSAPQTREETVAQRFGNNEGAHFALALTLGWQFGGEELVSVSWSDGGTSSLNAGDALSIAGGVLVEPFGGDSHVLQLQATVGYNYTAISASNASAKLTQIPVELLAFYRYRPSYFRIGGGLQYQIDPTFESKGLGIPVPVSFGNALGVVVQGDWVFYESFTASLRYTFLSYSPPLLSESVSGGGVAIGLTFAPRLF